MKRLAVFFLSLMLITGCLMFSASASYVDVPKDDILASEVERATQYGLMNGYGDGRFGFRDSMTRAQFATVLSRMFTWAKPEENTITSSMQVNGVQAVYLDAIMSAVQQDVIDSEEPFRPNDAITRGEMAEMLVRALGLKGAAEALGKTVTLPFGDVIKQKGYIAVAYDIGMTKGTSSTTFSPDATATRAQAAAMLLRIYEKLNREEDPWLHAYYAISSYSQVDLGEQADAVTLGWSRMTWDGENALLLTTAKNGNEYYIPDGYEKAVKTLGQSGCKMHLGVYMDTGAAEMLSSEKGRSQAVEAILEEVTVSYKALKRNPYSGVTIDFEGLRAPQRENFTAFLKKLSEELQALDLTMYVCVSPVLSVGAYYDGYDYRSIESLADKLILMAYDYDAKILSGFVGTEYYQTAASAPIDQVYLAIRSVTDPVSGVIDADKIVLGCSNKNIAWKIDENGKLLSEKPAYPSNETVLTRIKQADTERKWSSAYGLPYATYKTEDGETYFLWYENSRSIQLKVDVARLFGIQSLSFWRLGMIPDYNEWNWSFK